MGILSSVLPGLRDLRAPLMAGYLWILGVWMLFAEAEEANRVVDALLLRLEPFVDALGALGGLGALSVSAYLVGSIFRVHAGDVQRGVVARGLFRLVRLALRVFRLVPGARELDPTTERAVRHSRFREAEISRLVRDAAKPEEAVAVAAALRDFDGPAAAIRLHIKSRELWDQYDRLLGEAEFALSAALAVPVLALGVGVTVGSAAAVVAALVLGAATAMGLFLTADYRAQQANGVLLQTILTGEVEDPVLGVYAQA